MKQSKLKCHLQQKHPEHIEKDLNFFERQNLPLKRKKLDTSGYFQEQSTANLTTSFEVLLQIAKQKKPHNIGETFVKPCAVNMVKLILGKTSAKNIQQVSLSNDTIKRCISLMATDVKQQVIAEIKSSPMFSNTSRRINRRCIMLTALGICLLHKYGRCQRRVFVLQGLGNFSHCLRCNGQHLKFFRYRRLAVGKALW